MSLVPTRHFYPTSFFDSFQTSQVRFFRHGSSISRKNFNFYVSSQQRLHYRVHSSSNPEHNPVRKYNRYVRRDQKNGPFETDKNLSTGKWVDAWKNTYQPNWPKPEPSWRYQLSSDSESECPNERSKIIEGGIRMEKIVAKLKKFGYMDGESMGTQSKVEKVIQKGSVDEIFKYKEGMLPTPSGAVLDEPAMGIGGGDVWFPWKRPRRLKDRKVPAGKISLAELTLPEPELTRLRRLAVAKKQKTRIKGTGVTQEVVNMIHEKWKVAEIIKLKIEGSPAISMKMMHETLERKTGGLVVWRSGTSLSLYRGVSYEVPVLQMNKRLYKRTDVPLIQTDAEKPPKKIPEFFSNRETETALQKVEPPFEVNKDTENPKKVGQYEDEMDQILDGLGPRFEYWHGVNPVPVDADLIPGEVPRFEPPFRILPYGVRRSLSKNEATLLKRLARFLPPHFALGRSKQLQGLAMAIIKLWEKSSVVKVALKRGVQLTSSERMAEELKKLTGGILLSRNKFYLVFYRGKDFLSPEVTDALVERDRLAVSLQDEEELARLRASAFIIPQQMETRQQSRTAGTLGETVDANAKWGKKLDDRVREEMLQQAEMVRHAGLVRKLERKLDFAERKLTKAERDLAKVEGFLQPSDQQADPDSITDEERFMFRKLGLRMKAFLLLGRRGVFDGTVENMHLHWKYRELVKIIINARTFEQVRKVALALEAESRGVLVSVDKISKKKFAIIVYRGRDYKRPTLLRPKNLLTKRKALARSIELQRQQGLLNHISTVQSKVDRLRSELEQMETIKDEGDKLFYDSLDSAYPTSDEDVDSDEDSDETYVEAFGNEDNEEDESNELIRNLYEEIDSREHDSIMETETRQEFSQQDYLSNGSLSGDESEEEDCH